MTEETLYLTGRGEPFLAVHHVPESGAPDLSAVLIVPPFGWEEMATYRARREWALQLAGDGHHVLRIDLPGTGDSPGTLDDPGRWESWVEAVHRAAAWLRSSSGAPRVAGIGIGTGGYLVHDAAAAGLVEDIVLWATPAQGKRFLRELSTFARLEANRIAESGGPPSPEPTEGIEAGGFVLPPELVDRIGAVDLEAAPLPVSTRVLLLDRDGAGAGKLGDALREAGIDVESAEGTGYAAMVQPPDLSQPPRAMFALVGEWLDRAPTSGASTTPSLPEEATGTIESGAVRERPVVVERPGASMRGIVAEPASVNETAPLALVFLNAGAIRRTGPNRLWARAARRWAGRGVPSLRLDVEGIGDADGDGTIYQEVGAFHDPHLLTHVAAALDALVEQGFPSRFVLIGLCSGGHWAFKTALRDERAAAAVLINTRILYWHEHLDPARDLHRTRLLVRPVTWKRLLRGDVPIHRWKSFIGWAAGSFASRVRRSGTSVFEWQARSVAEGFTSLRDSGRSAHFVFCDGEPLRDELTVAGLLPPPQQWPNVTATFIPGREHTLKPVWMHPHAERALDEAIERELALVREPSKVA